jgi:hypothetical protein
MKTLATVCTPTGLLGAHSSNLRLSKYKLTSKYLQQSSSSGGEVAVGFGRGEDTDPEPSGTSPTHINQQRAAENGDEVAQPI